jgi:hypothetical protein
MTVMSLPLSGIGEDPSFRFSSGHASEALVRSVRESGIRTPLHAVSRNGGFRLLSGFKRHDAAVSLGFESVPAVLVIENGRLPSIFREILLEQASIRNFSLMEKARTLGILDRMGVDWESLRSDFLQVLEIPGRKETADEIRSLLGLSEAVRSCIEGANFTLAQAGCFHLFSSQGQDLLADWAIRLRLGGVELAEIAESVADISVRDKVPAEQWLAGSDCEALVRDLRMSRSEKITRIKAALFRRRFPTLDSLNRSMEEFRESLDLPSNVRIRWDPSFEEPGFVLEARIRDREDTTRLAGRLADPNLGDKWKKPFPNP